MSERLTVVCLRTIRQSLARTTSESATDATRRFLPIGSRNTWHHMTDWPARWFKVAGEFASWSKDGSTKVGCVIVGTNNQVLSGGYNGIPRGVIDDDPDRYERPAKYLWTEHAERNAIFNAARHGVALDGSTIYVPFFPCADCARGIIQVGIKRVITTDPVKEILTGDDFWNRWRPSLLVAHQMFAEAEIDIVLIERGTF